ncbi:hypothetical protein C0991_002941 [Blastosporella zonata]|nr:hypothetical protein C0991_002941 [Blastosporella zonata]
MSIFVIAILTIGLLTLLSLVTLFLGDAGTSRGRWWTPDWDKEFAWVGDGVFVITALTESVADKFVDDMEAAFAGSMSKRVLIKCKPRAEPQTLNDHFGYRGGISNPQIQGVTFGTTSQPEIRYPGSPVIPMGVIVMGYDGDEDKDSRPAWAKDGAFMVTRHLNTLVPEFDAFLLEHGPKVFPHSCPQAAADKLGARLFGRWKDGTPTELSPDKPDASISNNDKKINNFTYDLSAGQRHCPFAAHIRKSNPRSDVSPIKSVYKHFIRRQGMSFGPEVTKSERDTKTTIFARGQHFVCYASSIVRGFKHHQRAWLNDQMFPPQKDIMPGFDPVVGQASGEEKDRGVVRFMTGTDPSVEDRVMIFPQKFVDARGGAYFFAPSISTLRHRVAK